MKSLSALTGFVLVVSLLASSCKKDDGDEIIHADSLAVVGDVVRKVVPKPDNIQRITVQVLDNRGMGMANVVVFFTASKVVATTFGQETTDVVVTATSNAEGFAFAEFDLGDKNCQWNIVADLPKVNKARLSWTIYVAPITAAAIKVISGDKMVGNPDVVFTDNVTFLVTDANNNPVPDIDIVLARVSGDGGLHDDKTSVKTGSDGTATIAPKFGNDPVTKFSATAGTVSTQFEFYTLAAVTLNEPEYKGDHFLLTWSADPNPATENLRLSIQSRRFGNKSVDITPGQTSYEDHSVVIGDKYDYRLYVEAQEQSAPSNYVEGIFGDLLEFTTSNADAVFDRSGNTLYIASGNQYIYKIATVPDLNKDSIITSFTPQMLALSADAQKLYAKAGTTIHVLNPASGNVTASYDLQTYGAAISDLFPTADGGLIVIVDKKILFLSTSGDVTTTITSTNTINKIVGFSHPYVYVGEWHSSPNSLYKFDVTNPGGTFVLEDKHGSVSGISGSVLNDDGTIIYTPSGLALSTSDLSRLGVFASGWSITLSPDNQRLYTVYQNLLITSDVESFVPIAQSKLQLVDEAPAGFFVSSDESFAISVHPKDFIVQRSYIYKIALQ